MKRSEIYGLSGSVVLTILLILMLILIVLPGAKKPEDQGVMVSFGNVMNGAGAVDKPTAKPTSKPVVSTPPPVAKAPKPVKEKLMTQEDKSVAIAVRKKKEKEKKQREALEKKKLEEKKQAEEKKKEEQQAIQNANKLNGLFGKSGSAGSGTKESSSMEGNPLGSGNAGGNSWSLDGRSLLGRLAIPAYNNNVEGEVTVNIRVDEDGNVQNVSIGQPTTISDVSIRDAAMTAAKNTKFTKGNGVVTGKITYNFQLR